MDPWLPLQGADPAQSDWVAFAIVLGILGGVALLISWPMLRKPTEQERAAATGGTDDPAADDSEE